MMDKRLMAAFVSVAGAVSLVLYAKGPWAGFLVIGMVLVFLWCLWGEHGRTKIESAAMHSPRFSFGQTCPKGALRGSLERMDSFQTRLESSTPVTKRNPADCGQRENQRDVVTSACPSDSYFP